MEVLALLEKPPIKDQSSMENSCFTPASCSSPLSMASLSLQTPAPWWGTLSPPAARHSGRHVINELMLTYPRLSQNRRKQLIKATSVWPWDSTTVINAPKVMGQKNRQGGHKPYLPKSNSLEKWLANILLFQTHPKKCEKRYRSQLNLKLNLSLFNLGLNSGTESNF